MELNELKAARFKLLKAYYDLSGGDTFKGFPPEEVGATIGFDAETSLRLADYLENEQLLDCRAMGPIDTITHRGVKEVEAALSEPEKPTRYFPPVNLIHITGNVVNSAIQQASPEASQVLTINEAHTQDILTVLAQIKAHIDEVGLAPAAKQDLHAEVATVEAQLKNSRPKPGIISECLKSARTILEKVASNAAAKAVLDAITRLIGH